MTEHKYPSRATRKKEYQRQAKTLTLEEAKKHYVRLNLNEDTLRENEERLEKNLDELKLSKSKILIALHELLKENRP